MPDPSRSAGMAMAATGVMACCGVAAPVLTSAAARSATASAARDVMILTFYRRILGLGPWAWGLFPHRCAERREGAREIGGPVMSVEAAGVGQHPQTGAGDPLILRTEWRARPLERGPVGAD